MSRLIDFNLPPYLPNRRGGKLSSYEVRDNKNGKPGEVVLFCGPDEVADQLVDTFGEACTPRALTDKGRKKWTHAFEFPAGVPESATDLLDLLTHAVSIPAPEYVDHAIALDWYTVPDEDDLVHTDMGNCINWTKHATHPEWGNSRRARARMLRQLVLFIQEHPLYADATAIIACPGHKGDGQSFGEVMAREVATKVGIPFVESRSAGPRPAQKEVKQDLSEAFTVDAALSGRVIVVDDVYQSGGSARGAGAAARRAGATSVVSLAVARTISN